VVIAAGALAVACNCGSAPDNAPLPNLTPPSVREPHREIVPPEIPESTPRITACNESVSTGDPPVAVTPKVVAALRQIVNGDPVTGTWYLRLRVLPGGCCGYQHKLDLDTNMPSASDHAFASGGIKVVVLRRQLEMLRGAQVDYGEKDGKQGFMVKNPNFEGAAATRWLAALEVDKRAD
jgi:iron-sulfur cluster assembly accessory protein